MKSDRIASVAFFLMGAVMLRDGLSMPYMKEFAPGPGFFPIWLGGLLMLLSIILFFNTRRLDRPFIEDRAGFRKMMLVLVGFLVYIFALDYLGLLVGLILLLAFLVGWVERARLRIWTAVAGLGSLGCYLLFRVWLGVPLPIGILGI